MSVLYPPNFSKLSDGVIGSVVERRLPSYENKVAQTDTNQKKASHSDSKSQGLFGGAEASPIVPDTYLSDEMILNVSTHVKESSSASSTEKHREIPPMSERAILLRRERARRNMARYRERWLAHEAGLVADVQRLTEDIMKLEVQRQFVAANVPTNMTCWSVVAEYFRLFQYAHKSPHNHVVDQSFRGPTDLNVYRQFIQSTMTANVLAESGCGMEAILEDYRLYSLYQPDLDHRVIHLENGFEDTIVATTRLKVKISAITLRYAFPQLVSDPMKWETLGKKLLGQKFTLRGSVEFKWDADIQRIVSIQRTVDILTPFLELLGNLEDVVSVFENAMVTPDCTLVLDDALPISTNTTVSES